MLKLETDTGKVSGARTITVYSIITEKFLFQGAIGWWWSGGAMMLGNIQCRGV